MKRILPSLVGVVAAAALSIAGCAGAAPAPTPTKAPAAPTAAAQPTKAQAPAAPTKAAEPTKAPAAQPTAAPAKKIDFPQKGKPITIIIPFGAGGSIDVGVRALTPALEADLGAPFQVVNQTAGAGQTGMTDLAMAKPDGYTLGTTTLPTIIPMYLDPERKAVFNRKSFDPIALTAIDPIAVYVRADSPIKTMKDLIDRAKANPEKVTVATAVLMSSPHLVAVLVEGMTGVKFAKVTTTGGAQNMTNVLGGHVEAAFGTGATPQAKDGSIRVLAISGDRETRYYPGAKTLDSMGYKTPITSDQVISAPAGTPKEIVEILSASIKKALSTEDMAKRMDGIGVAPFYMGPAETAAHWDEMEAAVRPIILAAR